MEIKKFLFILLVISIFLLVYTSVFIKPKIYKQTKLPEVTFLDSTIYEINNKEVSQIIQSSKAYHYKNKDELYDATIVTRAKNNANQTDTISSKYMYKNKNKVKLDSDVVFNRSDEFTLSTPFLLYDLDTQIGRNEHKFKIEYKAHTLVGNILYFDGIRGIISAENTKFKIEEVE